MPTFGQNYRYPWEKIRQKLENPLKKYFQKRSLCCQFAKKIDYFCKKLKYDL